jgi:hypothetical protein
MKNAGVRSSTAEEGGKVKRKTDSGKQDVRDTIYPFLTLIRMRDCKTAS